MLNCPEWNFFDMGMLQIGAVHIPIYSTVSNENYNFILNDSNSEYLIVSNNEIYQRVKMIFPNVSGLKGIFSIEKVKGVNIGKKSQSWVKNSQTPLSWISLKHP